MFSNARKVAQQTARQLISGHYALIAWWALKHAGVLDALVEMEEKTGGGVIPLVHATMANMSPEILGALLEYLASVDLVVMKEGQAFLSAQGKGLLEYEDGVLELVRSYEPMVGLVEHVLARLKTPAAAAGLRKMDHLAQAQGKRYGAEVHPAVAAVLEKQALEHILDVTCGSGELLIHLAMHLPRMVGVGIGSDGFLVRKANEAITATGLEKRLIAVPANAVECCTQTKRAFERVGISRQLWQELDCLIVTNLFSEHAVREGDAGSGLPGVSKTLSAIPVNFPKAHVLLIEPTAGGRLEKNYYAAELGLLFRLGNSVPWTVEKWRETINQTRLRVVQEVGLVTDGLTMFLCKSG